MPTTAGMVSLLGATAKDDAEVVKRVLEAGALVLGKANLSVSTVDSLHRQQKLHFQVGTYAKHTKADRGLSV